MNLFTKRNRLTDRENKLMGEREEGEEYRSTGLIDLHYYI